MSKLKKFLAVFLLIAFFSQAGYALALEIKYPPLPKTLPPQEIEQKIEAGEIPEADKLPLYFKYFFNLAFAIVIIICTGVLIYGGVLYLVSPAHPAILVSAKKWINSALLGLLILVCSYAILYTINPQLTLFKLSKPKEIGLPAGAGLGELEKTITYTEIPLGQLIEQKIVSGRAEPKFKEFLDTAKAVVESSAVLKEKLKELKDLTESCSCGNSNCQASARIGLGGTSCFCRANPYQPCQINCDKEKIKQKMAEVREAIAELEKADKNLGIAQNPLTKDWSDIKKAMMAIDLADGILDYYTLLPILYFATTSKAWGEEPETKVEIEPYSESWPKVKAKMETLLKKIENQTLSAKEATTTNIAVAEEILSYIEAIKDQIGSPSTGRFMGHLDQLRKKINEALSKETLPEINTALQYADTFYMWASSSREVMTQTTEKIANSSNNFQKAPYQKSNIEKDCQEIEEILGETSPATTTLKYKLSEIKNLKEEAQNATTISTKLAKLAEIARNLNIVEDLLNSIWSPTVKITDPATFYLPTSQKKEIIY